MATIACVMDKNVAPDGSFYGWPAFSQRACADSAEGVLLSPVSLLLHLGGKGSIFISIVVQSKCELGERRGE